MSTSNQCAQRAHDVIMTSYQRRCDVLTSHRRRSDAIMASFACWGGSQTKMTLGSITTLTHTDVHSNDNELILVYLPVPLFLQN